jgi:transcriptional regulator with XRE-family HTH domain
MCPAPSHAPRPDQAVLGQVIAGLRKARKINQGELAARIGLTQSTLSRIESGLAIPDALMLRSLAHALGVTPNELFELVGKGVDKTRLLAGTADKRVAKAGESDWWTTGLMVLGAIGLGALVAGAVAALLEASKESD